MERRSATPVEAKVLSHPLRLRILRLCHVGMLTNKELADRLGRDPGTVLYHVRQLVRHGFLEEVGVRAGRRGALEKPYRSTGKSWELSLGFEAHGAETAVMEAFRQELSEAGPGAMVEQMRFFVKLEGGELDVFRGRVQALVDEFAARADERPSAPAYGGLFVLHRLAPQSERPDLRPRAR